MEYIIGILLLISFVGLAVYAVRGGNLMMGMLIMAIIWTVLPLIGNTFATNPEFIGSYPGITDISVVDAITKVFQSGPEGWCSASMPSQTPVQHWVSQLYIVISPYLLR